MKEIIERGATSQIVHVFIPDSASSQGAGKTGLSSSSSGLVIAAIRPGVSSATVFKQADSNIETITTIGTYQAPTSGKVRFKEIDSANLPGWYELHLADSHFDGTGGRRSLGGMIYGAGGVVPTPFQIQLSDPVRGVGSPTALPNANAESAGGLYTRGTGAGQINQPANGLIDANVVQFGGANGIFNGGRPEVNVSHLGGIVVASANGYIKVSEGTGTGQLDLTTGRIGIDWAKVSNSSNILNLSGTTIGTVALLGSGSIVAASFAANSLTATALSNDAVTEIQSGLASLANQATIIGLVDELESRLTAQRAANLDNLDATISSRSTLTAGNVWSHTVRTITGTEVGAIVAASFAANAINASALANDAVAEIQVGLATLADQIVIIGYVDELESRLTSQRATNLDNLDALVSSRFPTSSYLPPDNAGINALKDLIEADRYIDTIVTPWAVVLTRQGTGGPGVGVELLRQRLYTETGANITSISTFVGRSVAP